MSDAHHTGLSKTRPRTHRYPDCESSGAPTLPYDVSSHHCPAVDVTWLQASPFVAELELVESVRRRRKRGAHRRTTSLPFQYACWPYGFSRGTPILSELEGAIEDRGRYFSGRTFRIRKGAAELAKPGIDFLPQTFLAQRRLAGPRIGSTNYLPIMDEGWPVAP